MAFGGYLKQSTSVDVLIGPFLDETDGKTAETGLTIEDEHVLLSKNGQGLAAKNDANDAAHDAGGYHNCPLDATDTNTVGQLTLTCHMSGALPIRLDFQVLDTVPFDEMFKDAAAGMQGVIEVNNLDHLLKVGTGVAADGDLSNHIIDQTVFSHLLTVAADTDKYKASTDSLQGIRDRGDSAWVTATGFALASVVGALADAAAAGEVTEADTLMQYVKQLINILIGAAGIGAFPAEQAPANAISLAEVIRAIYVDTNALQTDLADGGRLDLLIDAIKAVTDNQAAASTTMIEGTVSHDNEVATTTVIYSDDVTEATADHYNGRLFVPTSGALLGQYTDITDYELENGEGKFTVTALTEAPGDDTTFVII